MTQILITMEDTSHFTIIQEVIRLIQGVKNVAVLHKNPHTDYMNDPDLADVPEEIRSLIGIASNLSEKDIAEDDRLAYILSK